MQINAGDLGMVDVNEEDIITFDKGLIGLHDLKKFVILKGDDQGVFHWLQSVDEPSRRFVLMEVSRFIGNYNPLKDDEVIEELAPYDNISELSIYNVTVIPETNFFDMTVNLKAPIIINNAAKKGFQYVSDNEKFPIRYYIQHELQKNKAGE